jgi:hypothetical protein
MAFRVDRVASLDRAAIRRSVLERFSAEAMATAYEDVYRRAAKWSRWSSVTATPRRCATRQLHRLERGA